MVELPTPEATPLARLTSRLAVVATLSIINVHGDRGLRARDVGDHGNGGSGNLPQHGIPLKEGCLGRGLIEGVRKGLEGAANGLAESSHVSMDGGSLIHGGEAED